jgi:hypothetical protein
MNKLTKRQTYLQFFYFINNIKYFYYNYYFISKLIATIFKCSINFEQMIEF